MFKRVFSFSMGGSTGDEKGTVEEEEDEGESEVTEGRTGEESKGGKRGGGGEGTVFGS